MSPRKKDYAGRDETGKTAVLEICLKKNATDGGLVDDDEQRNYGS